MLTETLHRCAAAGEKLSRGDLILIETKFLKNYEISEPWGTKQAKFKWQTHDVLRLFHEQIKVELFLFRPWRHTGGIGTQLLSFLRLAICEGELSTSGPGRFPRERIPVPTEKEAGWTKGPIAQIGPIVHPASFGEKKNLLTLTVFELSYVQSVT